MPNKKIRKNKEHITGLTTREVLNRQKKFGTNALPQEKPYSKVRLFFNQFNSSLIYILLTAVVISIFLGHFSDAVFVVIVLLINTLVNFYQELKAESAIRKLRQMVTIKVRVRRDDRELEIDSTELVPGDLVFLRAGDKVPADGKILEAHDLSINEASLTGESIAVQKNSIAEKIDSIENKTDAVFMGTLVEEGRGVFEVLKTGKNTELGNIVSMLKETPNQKTPLQKKIAYLSKIIGLMVLSVIALIVAVGYFNGSPFIEIFLASLALTVSAIPEGLLPGITIVLVLSMRRILKNKGLVRRLSSTETLGSVTVICTDKTGTLTKGEMRVSHIFTGTQELTHEKLDGLVENSSARLMGSHISALKIATMVNEAFVENPEAEMEELVVKGSFTEKALLLAGMQAGFKKSDLEKEHPIIDRLPFSSELKMGAIMVKKDSKSNLLFVLGSPESLLERSKFLDIDGKNKVLDSREKNKLNKKLNFWSSKGLRIVACAQRKVAKKETKKIVNLIKDLSLVGFIALRDPLRPDVKETIATTKKAGIRTVIITGDHKLTAKTVAEEIGLSVKSINVLEGFELDKMSDSILRKKAKKINLYARVSPRHKIRIVKALQANGEIVAMLGDGVNDAPAIKASDIGVAVGSGTDVAKEVADLVLLDDNFTTVVKAVEQGRLAFENIRKIFIYLIADDFSELFLFIASISLGMPLPLLPAQILWINLVEDGFPNTALTTEKETAGIMNQKPRDPEEPILNRPMKLWMIAIFFVSGLTAFISFYFLYKLTNDIEKARTMVFALMCLDSLIFAFSVRSLKQSLFRKDIFSNRYLVLGVSISFFFFLHRFTSVRLINYFQRPLLTWSNGSLSPPSA